MQRLALKFAIAGPLSRRHDIDAVIAEDALQLGHVGEPRHVLQDQGFLGQKSRDHQWQGRVLRAGNRNGAVELVAADDANAIHANSALLYIKYKVNAVHMAKALQFAAI